MNELETLKRAKMYIEKLANGINPLDDTAIPSEDIANNVRLSRCFFYVANILDQAVNREEKKLKRSIKKTAFSITSDKLEKIQLSDTPLPVSKIADLINSLIDTETQKKLSHRNITDWLLSIEMLEIVTLSDGKTAKRPTEFGKKLGISTEDRMSLNGAYTVVIYNRNAQQFIIDNIDAITAMINSKKIS